MNIERSGEIINYISHRQWKNILRWSFTEPSNCSYVFLHNSRKYNIFIINGSSKYHIINVTNKNLYFNELMHTFNIQYTKFTQITFYSFYILFKIICKSNYSSIAICNNCICNLFIVKWSTKDIITNVSN